MSTYTIERAVDIDAPVEVVWRTITEPDQVLRWFSDAADIEPRPGASGTLTFRRGAEGDPSVVNLTVVDVDPPHRYSFRWNYPSDAIANPANSLLVTFTLSPVGPERTSLRVEETGLDALDWPDEQKDAYADEHRQGWQTLADRLEKLLAPTRD